MAYGHISIGLKVGKYNTLKKKIRAYWGMATYKCAVPAVPQATLHHFLSAFTEDLDRSIMNTNI